MAEEPEKPTVMDLYDALGRKGEGFLQMITYPPGSMSEGEYEHDYVVFPLTKGKFWIEVEGEEGYSHSFEAREYWMRERPAKGGGKPMRIKVKNDTDLPIVIMKG